MTRMFTTAAVVLAAVLAAGAAHAADRIVVLQRPLSYQAADLTTPQGARKFLARVESVALQLCRTSNHSVFEHPIASQIEACRSKAVSRAVAELDAPLVTAAFTAAMGSQVAAQ